MSDDERDELELIGEWCSAHGRRLAALALGLKLRKIAKRTPEPVTVVKTPAEVQRSYHERRTAEALAHTAALADDIAAYVKASDSFPVHRDEVEAHLDVRGQRLTDAVNLAIRRGEVVSRSQLGPKLSGYYTPETAPTINTINLKDAA